MVLLPERWSSLAGSGIDGLKINSEAFSDALTVASGGITGGISSTIAGGDFWQGMRHGLITTGLNHTLHKFTKPLYDNNGDDELEKYGPKKPTFKEGTPQWQKDFENWNYKVELENWNKKTYNEKLIIVKQKQAISALNQDFKEPVEQIAQLYTSLAYMGGSGMSSGLTMFSSKTGRAAIKGIDDIITNPSLLEGRSLSEVQKILKNTPGWEVGTMNRGKNAGNGWALRQLNSRGTNYTDLYIQYNPGIPRHFNGNPYWKVSSGKSGKKSFQAK